MKARKWLRICGFLIGLSASLARANVLSNASFENGMTHWSSKKGKVVCDEKKSKHGKCYFEVKGSKGKVLSQEWTFPALGRWLANAYIKGESGTGRLVISKKVHFDLWLHEEKSFRVTPDWQKIRMFSDVQDGISIRIRLYLDQKSHLMVDRVTLRAYDPYL